MSAEKSAAAQTRARQSSKKTVPTGPPGPGRHRFCVTWRSKLNSSETLFEIRLFDRVIEVKHIEQVGQRRHVLGNIRLVVPHPWVRQIVPAAIGEGAQLPVALDELQDGDVVGVRVIDLATRAV